MTIHKTTTAVSTRTRSSAKKTSCINRKIPTRSNHEQQRQHQQQNVGRLTRNTKSRGSTIESTTVPDVESRNNQVSCDANGIQGDFDQCDADSIMVSYLLYGLVIGKSITHELSKVSEVYFATLTAFCVALPKH